MGAILEFPKDRIRQTNLKKQPGLGALIEFKTPEPDQEAGFSFEISTLTADEFALLHDFIEPNEYFRAGRFKIATRLNEKTLIRALLIDGNANYWMLLTTEQDYQESNAASELETLIEAAEGCIR